MRAGEQRLDNTSFAQQARKYDARQGANLPSRFMALSTRHAGPLVGFRAARETDHGDRDETEAKFPQGIGGLSVALCDRLGSRPRATAQNRGPKPKN
jgi:hypothetical protein